MFFFAIGVSVRPYAFKSARCFLLNLHAAFCEGYEATQNNTKLLPDVVVVGW